MNEYSFIFCHNPLMAATAASNKRTASREKRRRQLIDATIKCIARKGMGSTSIGDVAATAGLSQGIVNLHFKSKENLLTETLRHVSDEYLERFDTALAAAGDSAASKLHAVMSLDFRPSICDRRKLAVWFAFYGEIKSRPTYRKICQRHDDYYDDVVAALCTEIIDEGRYKAVSANGVASMLAATTNGLWLSCLISPKSFDRHEAMRVIDEYLGVVFPKHFPLPAARASQSAT